MDGDGSKTQKWTGWMQNDARAAPMQSPCVAACRAVLTKLDDPGAHGDGWTQGQTQTRAAGMGSWQRQANEA